MHRGYLSIHTKPEGAIKIDRRWRTGWIPITSGEQEGHFLDFDPAENGTAGQVVRYSSFSYGIEVVGKSLDHWFDRLCEFAKNADPYGSDLWFLLPPISTGE